MNHYKPRAWESAARDAIALVDAGKSQFELEFEDPEPGWIKFNGNSAKGLDHESFWLALDPDVVAASGFEFCKTAQKPYDVVVTAILAVMAEVGLNVSSDGDADDWKPGLTFAADVLNRPVTLPPGIAS
jgi:hypothetical protein